MDGDTETYLIYHFEIIMIYYDTFVDLKIPTTAKVSFFFRSAKKSNHPKTPGAL